MTVFDRLQQAMKAAQEEQDLPDFLAEKILFILMNQERFRFREEIEHLVEQVRLYDTYGQTGYLGMGVSNLILDKTLQRLIVAQPEQSTSTEK